MRAALLRLPAARAASLRALPARRAAPAPHRTRCAAGSAGDGDARARLQRSFDAPATMPASERSVLGAPLSLCCSAPKTGFFRDGHCCTGPEDLGRHVVCAQVTAEFLAFSKSRGNDLMTPRPEFAFPGLKPGDRWCLCASRWAEALRAGCAPPVVLGACAEAALAHVSLDDLKAHALPDSA